MSLPGLRSKQINSKSQNVLCIVPYVSIVNQLYVVWKMISMSLIKPTKRTWAEWRVFI